jgi:hypothetical protein
MSTRSLSPDHSPLADVREALNDLRDQALEIVIEINQVEFDASDRRS